MAEPPTVVDLVVNPASGGGRTGRRIAELTAALTAAGAGHITVHVPQDPASATTALAALAAEHRPRVVLAGGDGLVGRAVAALATTSTALAVLPVGSGNDFARAFGLKAGDLTGAARVALGPVRPIDVLMGPGGAAASVATAGFSVTVNERANTLRLGPLGGSRYDLATLLELPRFQPIELTVAVDGGPPTHHRSMLVAVANTRFFGGGMDICPAASPDDGLLDVTVVEAVSRLELLRTFRRVFKGTHLTHPAVRTYRGTTITRERGDGPLSVWADGEPFGDGPITLRAEHHALRLAAGAAV